MTQPSRTTETINRDNAAIRDIMLQIRELTVPDRATLALGLVGHLATMMNRSQMTKLMGQLQEEAERVQDVPPSRQRDDERAREDRESAEGSAPDARTSAGGDRKAFSGRSAGEGERGGRDDRAGSGRAEPRDRPRKAHGDILESQVTEKAAGARESVGQAGRGEFRSRKLV